MKNRCQFCDESLILLTGTNNELKNYIKFNNIEVWPDPCLRICRCGFEEYDAPKNQCGYCGFTGTLRKD